MLRLVCVVAIVIGLAYCYENIEGGHGSGSTNAQRARIRVLELSYPWKMVR